MNKQSQKELLWNVDFDLEAGHNLSVLPHRVGLIHKHTLFTKKKKGAGKGQSRAKVFYVQNNSFENLDFIRRG